MAGYMNEFSLQKPEDRKIAHKNRWYFLNKFLNKSRNEDVPSDDKVLVQEFEPQPNWTLPEIDIDKLYKMPIFQFRAAQLFRFTSVNIPISTGQSVYQIPLIQPENIKWGLENGYRYIHICIIQFGINPLVRPGLNTSCLTCVLDTRMNNFNDTLLGGFQSPLNNGPVWSSVIPRYQVSLIDPYINEFLNAYIQFYGFNVASESQIAQLHASICLRFVSTSMPPLNHKLADRALK